MATNPSADYPGKITAPSVPYPYGEARNITVPGDGTGTPLDQKWLNDFFGLSQALLKAHGVTPSGTPDQVGASQLLQCLVAEASGLAVNYVDSGAADAYILTPSTDNEGPDTHFEGMEIIFVPTNANTGGAVTVNVAGIGVVGLKTRDGANPLAGVLSVTTRVVCHYDTTGGYFKLDRTDNLLIADTLQSRLANKTPILQDPAGREMGQPAKAWVSFDGSGTAALRGTFNVTSLTDLGTGTYRVNLTNALASTNAASPTSASRSSGSLSSRIAAAYVETTTSISIRTYIPSTDTLADIEFVSAAVYADD